MSSDRNSGIQRSEACSARDPLLRRRAEQRDPQAAVGGEALLRREVVGVDLRDVDGQPAGAGRGVDRDERVGGAGRAKHRRHHAGGGLVVSPRDQVGPLGLDPRRVGRVAGVGRDDDGICEERSAGGDGGELLRELAESQVQRAALDEAERRGVPERCRAAVAERYLIALGQREQLAQPAADLSDERLDGLLAMRGAHQRAALCRQPRDRRGTHLRWPAAEAPVSRLQLSWDDQLLLRCLRARRHRGSSLGLTRRQSSYLRCPGARRKRVVAPRW